MVIFHQSSIADYCRCPKLYYYKHILGMTADRVRPKVFFGSVMHRLLQYVHQNKRVFDEIGYYDEMISSMEEHNDLPVFWTDRNKEIADFINDAIPTLQNYWAKPYNRNAEILLAEAEFKVDIGKFKFAGTIDQLRKYNDEIILIDFKTGQAKTSDTVIELDYQLSIYAWACMHGEFNTPSPDNPTSRFRIFPDKVGIYRTQDHLPYKRKTYFKNGKPPAEKGDERGPGLYLTTRKQPDFDAMVQDLSTHCRLIIGPHYDIKINKLAKGGAFGRTPNMANCVQCAFKDECLTERRDSLMVEKSTADEARNQLEEIGMTE